MSKLRYSEKSLISTIIYNPMSYKKKSWNEQSRTLITFFFALLIGSSLLLGESRWETSPLTEETLMLLACFFAGVGAFGRIWCSLYIAGYKNSTLVKSGPYALCRNPLYLFSFIGGTGVALATETFTIPLLVILAFACYYPFIILREQKRLIEIFGKDYKDYCRETPSFFPTLHSIFHLKQPETYTVNPRTFTHNFIDALWFIWLIGIFEFVSGLHEAGILPVLFQLP
jgi:protein-S-isoprenylcysteine O-methyltransferase Ste14